MAKTTPKIPIPQESHELDVNQEIAIAALVAGSSMRDAAVKAGVGERTLRRWRREDVSFETTLRQSIEAIRHEMNLQIVSAAQQALSTLTAIAADPAHPQALRAACQILTMARVSAPLNPRATLGEVAEEMLADMR